jgi:beta-phosphoglucomutase family hydrolase
MNKAVIFDFDGVLIDSGPAHQKAWAELGESIGKPFDEKFFKQTFGMPNEPIIKMWLGENEGTTRWQELADIKEQKYRELVGKSLIVIDGGFEFAKDLKSLGWKIAIGSSAPAENISLILKIINQENLFDEIVKAGDYENGKPNPDVFLTVAKKLNVSPEKCIVFEDAVVGVTAAKSAGMKCVAITTTSTSGSLSLADIVVDRFSELDSRNLVTLLD